MIVNTLLSRYIFVIDISIVLFWQVNNKDIRQATHQEAVMALIAPTFEIILEVRHDPMPNALEVSSIHDIYNALEVSSMYICVKSSVCHLSAWYN